MQSQTINFSDLIFVFEQWKVNSSSGVTPNIAKPL